MGGLGTTYELSRGTRPSLPQTSSHPRQCRGQRPGRFTGTAKCGTDPRQRSLGHTARAGRAHLGPGAGPAERYRQDGSGGAPRVQMPVASRRTAQLLLPGGGVTSCGDYLDSTGSRDDWHLRCTNQDSHGIPRTPPSEEAREAAHQARSRQEAGYDPPTHAPRLSRRRAICRRAVATIGRRL